MEKKIFLPVDLSASLRNWRPTDRLSLQPFGAQPLTIGRPTTSTTIIPSSSSHLELHCHRNESNILTIMKTSAFLPVLALAFASSFLTVEAGKKDPETSAAETAIPTTAPVLDLSPPPSLSDPPSDAPSDAPSDVPSDVPSVSR